MKKKLLLPLVWLLLLSPVFTQDAHYSQVEYMPLYLNPGLTGMSQSKWRIGGNYRSQWVAINAPYRNFGISVDKNNERLSFGLLMNQNKAGDTGFQHLTLGTSAALKKRLAEGNNFLSLGVQLGFVQQRIDWNQLTFDNHYNPDKGYDPDQGSGETIERSSVILPNLALGANWSFSKNLGRPIDGKIGLAFDHLNSPQASLFEDNVKFPIKTTFYGMADIKISDQLSLEPRAIYSAQQTARELLIGLRLGLYFNEYQAIKLGLAQRSKDALILLAALEMDNWILHAAYDWNTSALQDANTGNTAFELGLVFHFPKKERARKVAEPQDRDEDGILDEADDCPDVPGIPEKNGCPDQTLPQTSKTGNDYDGDGILDSNDLCPYEAGLAKYQGCNDRDEDGIWDHLDACPLLPGKVENFGCPVKIPGIDSDNDGVPDRFDKCLYIKGSPELDGCPDSDGDGISDIKDECPYLKGTLRLNGCPEERGAAEISVDVVEFDTDESKIFKRYYPMLDRVAFYLKNNPQVRLILEGHTDNEGDHLYNYSLSQRRVIAVRNYLLRHGLRMEQLETHFYGETKPKSANDSAGGKARNRRVELQLFR